MLETSTILRSLLYQLEMAKTLEEARDAVRAMCQKDDIAHVKALIADKKSAKGEAL